MIKATKDMYPECLQNLNNRLLNNIVENSFGYKKNRLLNKNLKRLMPSAMLYNFYMEYKAKFNEHYTGDDQFKRPKKQHTEKFRQKKKKS
jgi:hypothetical protein